MPKRLEISGQRFGSLVAVARGGQDAHKRWLWKCRCDCGQIATISQNNLRTGNSQSCGCTKLAALRRGPRRRPSGESHYRWIADRSKVRWRPFAVKVWSRSVIATCAFCARCGTSSNLHAHHADGWSANLLRRLDLTNGIALCVTHHREFHRQYGRQDNTQEQLHEYLGFPVIDRGVIDTKLERPQATGLARIFDGVVNAGRKGDALEDLRKARWYLDRYISNLEAKK